MKWYFSWYSCTLNVFVLFHALLLAWSKNVTLIFVYLMGVCQIFVSIQRALKPGPASTVEEHSLHKFLIPRDRRSNMLHASIFFRHDLFAILQICLTSNLRSMLVFSESRNPSSKKNCCNNLTVWKGYVARSNWLYGSWVLRGGLMTIYSTTLLYTTNTATYRSTSPTA